MSLPLVALTGATGFIGRALLAELPRRGYRIRVLLRRPTDRLPDAASAIIGDLTGPRDFSTALSGVDAVIHSAGLAHAMSGVPADDYRAINTEGTLALARAASRVGARRFLFLSSIRAQSGPVSDWVLTEADPPAPTDDYGRSKLAAEQGLAEIDLDWAALRPVLVYGSGVSGNMAALLGLARSRAPLPLGSLTGRRSLLAVENLVEAVDLLLRHPGPLRRPVIVADPEPVTLPQMIAAIRRGFGRPPGLLPAPVPLLRLGARLAGRAEAFERLSGSLMASPAALMDLGWRPPVATFAGLEALARAEAKTVPQPR
jgi:nucleoside-diphosphate-sugar epimerase